MSAMTKVSDVRAWLDANYDPAFLEEDLKEMVASMLQFHREFEGNVFLRFKFNAIVMGLDHPDTDVQILKHYGERGIMEYESVVSKSVFADYNRPLRLTRVAFSSDESHAVMDAELQRTLHERALTNDHVQYDLRMTGDNKGILNFCWKNAQRRMFGYHLVSCCRSRGLRVGQLRFQYVDPLTTHTCLLGSIQIQGDALKKESHRAAFFREFSTLREFGRIDDLQELLVDKNFISNNKANLLRSLCTLVETGLADVDANLYTSANVMDAYCFHPELTLQILKAFSAKFHPKDYNMEKYKTIIAQLQKSLSELDTGKKKHDDRRRTVFKQTINILDHILKTNYYCVHKLGIGFRLDPRYMDHIPGFDRAQKYPELPYGIFFISTTDSFGFQIRFRDLSRGGMRTVISQNWEHARYERSNMFGEVYNLAYTQQKKNKDIPEGGAKAILFLLPNDDLTAEIELIRTEMTLKAEMSPEQIATLLSNYQKEMSREYMYYNQRCFVNTFLTLFVASSDGKLKDRQVVDHLGQMEFIYLGPDENMHDSMIEWISHESVRMGYAAGGAFISGKEETGINHKEYGVTSLGVFQYVKRALEFIGLDGKPYTAKITGGPDGDVAGNMIRLLNKHHKKIVSLTVITDASGTVYDPEGLDLDQLESQFHKVQPIASYPPEKLHDGAFLLCLWQTRQKSAFAKETLIYRKKEGKVVEDWLSSNEAQQLFSTNAHHVYSDVFIPCGGRPRTLNIFNVENAMIVDGKVTCRAMVEGANLYITQDAREFLEDRGLILFRDSSANKCGVISSSYEILGGLSLDDEQFVKIKPDLARNLLLRLEDVADAEAKAMIAYFKEKGGKVRMSQISEIVSRKINDYTDAIAAYLQPIDLFVPAQAKLFDIFANYVPTCISSDPKLMEQCMKRVPQMHMKAIIATVLASRLVYGKGLSWDVSVVDILPIILS